jgi:multidrug efflux system membrane fusion protein
MSFRPKSGCTLLLCAGLMMACSRNDKPTRQPPAPVVVAEVVTKTVPYEIPSIGNVEAYRTVSIRAQVSGVVDRLFFREGQNVRKGTPLFLIDPAPYQAALDAATAKLTRDQITANNIEENFKRYDELVKKDYITPQQHSDMRAQLEAMKATVRADEAEVESAKLNLDYCSIVAPIDGRIGVRLVDEGNVVRANSDNSLVVIHQIRPIFVRFTVPEKYLPDILKHSAATALTVTAHAPEETPGAHQGRLTFIDNAVSSATGTILLKAEFSNKDTMLWPGEFVNVVLVLKQLENAVVVPAQAIGTGQQGDYVFVVKADATVELRQVKVAYRLDNDAVIETGVQPGEKVVVDGQLRLRPGSAVVEKPALTGTETREPSDTSGASSS